MLSVCLCAKRRDGKLECSVAGLAYEDAASRLIGGGRFVDVCYTEIVKSGVLFDGAMQAGVPMHVFIYRPSLINFVIVSIVVFCLCRRFCGSLDRGRHGRRLGGRRRALSAVVHGRLTRKSCQANERAKKHAYKY